MASSVRLKLEVSSSNPCKLSVLCIFAFNVIGGIFARLQFLLQNTLVTPCVFPEPFGTILVQSNVCSLIGSNWCGFRSVGY